jgi:3',5'-cyclic AMP phosphodiesterase CpdA
LISLLHVSDLHFGPKHQPDRARAILELARRAPPDALVVSGDFTQRAKSGQFAEARAWLAGAPCPVAFVPGNHDVPLYRVWERLFAPFGVWRRHLDRELVRETASEPLAIFGLNTAHAWTTKHGRVERAELARLAGRLAAAPRGALKVLVAHHPLSAAAELDGEPVARRAAAALELCRRAGVELVLCGHLHHAFVVEAADGAAPLVVHCGTTSSTRGRCTEVGRNSLNWIEVSADSIRVERRLWDATAGGFRAASERVVPRSGARAAQDPRPPSVS